MKSAWGQKTRTFLKAVPYLIALEFGIIVIAILEDEKTRHAAASYVPDFSPWLLDELQTHSVTYLTVVLVLGALLIGGSSALRRRGESPFTLSPGYDPEQFMAWMADARDRTPSEPWSSDATRGPPMLRKRFRPRGALRRCIHPAEAQALVHALSKTPSDLNLEVVNDPEAGYLALQITEIFSKSGWRINPSYLDISTCPVGGTLISSNDNAANLAVIQAFREIGLACAVVSMPEYTACVGVPDRNLPVSVLISAES